MNVNGEPEAPHRCLVPQSPNGQLDGGEGEKRRRCERRWTQRMKTSPGFSVREPGRGGGVVGLETPSAWAWAP